jgi:hypothetical protein
MGCGEDSTETIQQMVIEEVDIQIYPIDTALSDDIDGDGFYLIDELPLGLSNGPALSLCCLSSIGAGMLLPTGYAIFSSPMSPAERFLGKSPDYVDTYTTTYKRHVKEQRIVLSATGCLVSTCLGISLLSRFLPPEYYEDQNPD